MSGVDLAAFAQGRKAALNEIKKLVVSRAAGRMEKARQAVQDHISHESELHTSKLTDEQKSDLAQMHSAVEIAIEAWADTAGSALNGLLAGHSVYDLLGTRPIPTYTAITGGDMRAGIMSAVDDVKIMLMSFDVAAMTDRVFNEICADRGLGEDQKPMLRKVLSYCVAIEHDSVLFNLNDQILGKMKPADIVQYEDGRVENPSNLSARFFTFVSTIAHHSMRDGRRASKLPRLWPPLKIDTFVEPEVTQQQPVPVLSDPAAASAPDVARAHDRLSAKAGYLETAVRFFDALQNVHFRLVQGKTYARESGLPVINEPKVQEIGKHVFGELRAKVAERISAPPKLAGVFRDGLSQAWDDMVADIEAIGLPSGKADATSQRIVTKLKDQWAKTLHVTTSQADQEGPRFTHVPAADIA